MNVYLTKWKCNGAEAYKIGISKWGKERLLEERFGDRYGTKEQYDIFEKEILACIEFSSETYSLARAAAVGMEHTFHALCPKDFRLEEHFDLQDGSLDGMGGISEFFLMPEDITEDILIRTFKSAQDNKWKMENKLKSYRGTASTEMNL